jgi:hypothetical protein
LASNVRITSELATIRPAREAREPAARTGDETLSKARAFMRREGARCSKR